MHSGNLSSQAIENWLFNDTTTPEPTPEPTNTTAEPTNTPQPAPQPGPQAAVGKEEIEKFVTEGIEEGEEEKTTAPSFFKDYTDLYSRLQEKNIAYPLEEGYVPKTEEEFWDALSQSAEYNANQRYDKLQQERVQALPDPLKRVFQYAEQGVTTAQELSRYVNALSQYEAVSTLDPAKAEDQERIVLLHLLNTGLNEQEARAEIADLNELKKLDGAAKRYFPALKKTYDDSVRVQEKEKQDILEQEKLFVDNNGTNAAYFLDEKNQDFLPFKVTSPTLKKSIWELAAAVVDVNDKNEAIFAWERHLKSLMMGDEASYKRFIKIITFMADDAGYDQNVATSASSNTNKTNFRKIAVDQGKGINHAPQETQEVRNIQTPPSASRVRWAGK